MTWFMKSCIGTLVFFMRMGTMDLRIKWTTGLSGKSPQSTVEDVMDMEVLQLYVFKHVLKHKNKILSNLFL